MTLKESSQISPNQELSHAVKLFGTKISVSVSEDRKAPQNSEDAQASNVDEFSASTSCSEDDKVPSLERPEQSEEQEDKRSRAGLKRPDKPVPCPRCNSLDTKFCYFNNYNVNQPRHFCKNCQRYWTAGGTLRNVPVGAGRRKNKGRGLVDSQENTETRQLGNTLSEKRPLVAGLASPKQGLVSPKQGLASHKPGVSSSEEASEGSNDSRDDSTCGSSSNPIQECRGSNSYSTTPLTMLNIQSLNGARTRPPFPLVAGPIWNPAGNWTAAWNSPWANLAATAASAAAKAIAHNVGSLGKHIRDEETGSSRSSSVLAPKTLRIDASQCRTGAFLSDISVGNKVASISTGGMFKAFQQESSASTRRTSDGTIDAHDITKVCEAGLDKQGDLGERVRNDGNTGDTS